MAEGRHLDNWIDGYVKFLENTESPDVFKKWVAISTVGGALGRKCQVEWIPRKPTFPNMFIVLVGPAAIGKGVSMGPAAELMEEVKIRTSAQAITLQALIEDLILATTADTVNGVLTQETSLTVFSEEFSVFLGHQNHDLISNLTTWFDCPRTWTYKTKSRGEETIYGLALNILGATTPGILQKSLTDDAISGGFTSRVILVFADQESRIVPIPAIYGTGNDLFRKLSLDLHRIKEMRGSFNIEQTALDLWIEWYVKQKQDRPFSKHKQLSEYAGRRPMHLQKLMMIYSAARASELIIREEDFLNAKTALEEVEHTMPNAFRGYGRNELAQFIELAMEEIRSCGILYIKDFIKNHRSDVTAEDMNSIIQTLIAMGFCTVKETGYGKVLHYVRPKKDTR